MRLSVFIAENSAQLFIDLGKIYKNYFTDEQLTQESLMALANDPASTLFVTMFNERHLGAVRVTINDKKANLSLLTIRDLTRRRGIAKNLLVEVDKYLIKNDIESVEMESKDILEEEKEVLTLFMQDSGYQLTQGVFSKNL